jgi:hypothetical protein
MHRTFRLLLSEALVQAAIVLPAAHLTAVAIYLWSGQFGLEVCVGCILWVGVLVVALLHCSTRPLRGRWQHLSEAADDRVPVWNNPSERHLEDRG